MAFDKEKYESSEYRNDWALDVNHEHIHISQAESGANGYFCLGCDKEMQACKGEKVEHYFRHHIKDVNKERIECVVASRKYREQLASSILNRLKYVKVPTLYKYPESIDEGAPMLLEKSKTIEASYTKSELTFYENDEGVVHWGANKDIEDRYLLIRPDVTFFDSNDKPILFIEFVIHHKPDLEKRNKLKRIGIDAVQIIIPKLPPSEIEKAIKSVSKYKWLYNELEANTQYIPISKSHSETIQPIDEEQVKLIRESFECKSAEIKQLINSIEKCLRTERFKTARRTFELEISRVKENTERERKELGALEESNREKAFNRNRGEEERVEARYRDLEGRYTTKDFKLSSDIERAERERDSKLGVDEQIRDCIQEIAGIEEEERAIEKKLQYLDEEIRKRVSGDINNIRWDIEDAGTRYRNLPTNVFQEFRRANEFEESEIRSIEIEDSTIEDRTREAFEEDEKREREYYQEQIKDIESKISEVEREEGTFEEAVREQFDREVESNSPELTKELRTSLESKRILDDYLKAECEETKYRSLQELFKKRIGL